MFDVQIGRVRSITTVPALIRAVGTNAVTTPAEAGAGYDLLLAAAVQHGDEAPLPGGGATLERFELLAALGAADLGGARAVEPHLDALAILAELRAGGHPVPFLDPTASWGVYAAEATDARLTASVTADSAGREVWRLDGVKPWCSLADSVSHALVTAHTGAGSRRLFAVDLRSPGVALVDAPWVARGLAAVRSTPVRFEAVPADPIGADGWYLERVGFAWGGIGVAACWWGAAVAVARALGEHLAAREPRELALAALGAAHRAVETGRLALADAAARIDADVLDGSPAGSAAARDEAARDEAARDEAARLAHTVRGTVVASVDAVVSAATATMGPLPLVSDETFARRIADLELYTAQYHRGPDDVAIGRSLVTGPSTTGLSTTGRSTTGRS